ncbi:PadR family transcriptional regulator [Variovorax sp. H27-G14]|uniref:PadR family transcriptional regulator n=1 Tax=Variovorax sp. H27-G14 TaxID=3111914 RepID=UPI0038FC47DB
MSLPHALLTALVEQPGSGSELAGRFDRSIGYFWHATHQQIYRELARLEEAGWVEALPAELGRGRKKVYCILSAGRDELGRWLSESTQPQPLRDEMMVRLRAAAAVGASSSLADEVRRRLPLHLEKLETYRQIEARDFSQPPSTQAAQLQRLVLQAGIAYESYWVDISRKALEILEPPSTGE